MWGGLDLHQFESAIPLYSSIKHSSVAAKEDETSAKKCHWARQTWEKMFSLICEEKHTESASQGSCSLWVQSVLQKVLIYLQLFSPSSTSGNRMYEKQEMPLFLKLTFS